MSWPQLIRSTGTLIRTQPVLVESSLVGASFFGAFSAFWTTLVFFLQRPPYHYGSAVAGLFGLVGAVGAAGAPLIGRRVDRRGARGNITFALLIVLVAFVVLWMFGGHMAGLIIGVILLDFGVQAGHVSNQTRIYALIPKREADSDGPYLAISPRARSARTPGRPAGSISAGKACACSA